MDTGIRGRRRPPRSTALDPPRPRPGTLAADEADRLLRELTGPPRLVAELLHGAGLRLGECLRLRLRDVDLRAAEVAVRGTDGVRGRTVPFPRRLKPALLGQMRRVRELHRRDLRRGAGRIPPPAPGPRRGEARRRLHRDRAAQYLFPARRLRTDPETGRRARTHLAPGSVRTAVRAASRRAGISPPVGCRELRHACAARLRALGYDRSGIRSLLGRRCAEKERLEG